MLVNSVGLLLKKYLVKIKLCGDITTNDFS